MTLSQRFLDVFIAVPHILVTVMMVIGVTWAKRNRKHNRSTTKPVLFAVFGPILCIILTILVIIFVTMDFSSLGRATVFLIVFYWGSLHFIAYRLPLLHPIFGMVWLGLLTKWNEPRKKYLIIWTLVQMGLMLISVLILTGSGPWTPNVWFLTR